MSLEAAEAMVICYNSHGKLTEQPLPTAPALTQTTFGLEDVERLTARRDSAVWRALTGYWGAALSPSSTCHLRCSPAATARLSTWQQTLWPFTEGGSGPRVSTRGSQSE